jgi:hypothetical protein
MNFIPFKVLQKALTLYGISISVLTILLKQTKRTTMSILDSFSYETLYFFPDSVSPLISSFNKKLVINPVLEKDCWSFSKNKFTYLSEVDSVNRTIPYISAALYKGEDFIGDLSEWLMGVEILSSKELPLRFVILAWAHINGKTLDSYLTSEYFLHVITTDGEDYSLNIKTA